MFKRLSKTAALGILIFAGAAAILYAYMQPVWTKPLANESALAYNNTYPFQTNNAHVDSLAFQCVYTSATIANVSFNDGVESTGTITVALNSGKSRAYVAINGVTLMAGRDWNWDAVASSATALSIAAAINANTTLNQVIIATAPAGSSVIYATSTYAGSAANYSLYSSTATVLTLSGTAMTGGADPQYATGTSGAGLVSKSNGYTPSDPTAAGALGFQVWFSTGSGVGISNLTFGTTYYVIPVSATSFKVASTLNNAKAGTYVVLNSSSPSTTTHSFTFNSAVIAGTPSFKFDVSNDGSNWNTLSATPYNVAISSVTMSAYTLGGASSVWDFGPFDYTWVRLNVIAPTTGGIFLKCTPNGEGQNPNQ